MGFLSRFDNKLAIGGIEEVDPGRDNIIDGIPNAFLMDPLAIPAAGIASGNLGPFGTPTEKGTKNELAVEGITDVAHDKGAEIAAIIALGSWLGGGGGEGMFGGGETAGAEAGTGAAESGAYYGYDPGAEGMYVGDGTAQIGGDNSWLLADAGNTGTTTDVSGGILGDGTESAGETVGSYDPGGEGMYRDTGASPVDTSTPANTSTSSPKSTTTTSDSGWMKQAKKYGVPLGLLGLSTALSSKKSEMPNKAQYQELSAEAQALAKLLIEQYKSGALSPAQQAQLDQLTQQNKNQINNYYASIGQAGSTSHQQALAKADMDGLALKANMLQTTLQQGLQAIGVAQGPLNAMANYQMQNDKRTQDAYANFARSAAYLYGMGSTPDGKGSGTSSSSGAQA